MPPSKAPLRVLIAEDSPTIRGYLRRTVQDLFQAVQVFEVEDGQAALEQVQVSAPDLLITDLHMPRLSGRDFLREAFRRGQLTVAPILVLSSSITLDLKAEFSGRGNVVFLRKPVVAADIRVALRGQQELATGLDSLAWRNFSLMGKNEPV